VEEANFLRIHRRDTDGAVEVLEAALAITTDTLGEDASARVGLLDELADTLASRATHHDAVTPGADEERSRALTAEALRVRRAAFGRDSLEAAEGWVRLSWFDLQDRPEAAEGHARRALAIALQHDDGVNDQVLDALTVLQVVARDLGRYDEAEDLDDLVVLMIDRLEATGQSPD
jgi:hypothetical protein